MLAKRPVTQFDKGRFFREGQYKINIVRGRQLGKRRFFEMGRQLVL